MGILKCWQSFRDAGAKRQRKTTKQKPATISNGDYMEQMPEVWLDVPETDGRFQISNKGRLRRIAKKKRLHNETIVIFEIVPVKMVADYKTGAFGWYVYFDNDKHFFERDKLMRLFVSIPIAINPEEEKRAIEVRDRGFNPEFTPGRQTEPAPRNSTWTLKRGKMRHDNKPIRNRTLTEMQADAIPPWKQNRRPAVR